MRVVFIFLLILYTASLNAQGFPQSYYEIHDSSKSKKFFFEHLYPFIVQENKKILEKRAFVQRVLPKNIFDINMGSKEYIRLLKLKKRYKISSVFAKDEFLKALDIVPPSLALAQAAIESGWGKSRFVKKANNLFGQWTWSEKGIIPKDRPEGKKYKIAYFETFGESIAAYMFNLNIGWAYERLRAIRYDLRKNGKKIDSLELAKGLVKYSALKEKYVKMVQGIISNNHLKEYDTLFFQELF